MTSLADEVERLAAQRDAGRLSDAEFESAKARLFAGSADAASVAPSGVGRLRRSLTDRWIGGVCGGIGASLGVETWIVRLAFVLAVCFAGIGLLPYVLLWIFVPTEGR